MKSDNNLNDDRPDLDTAPDNGESCEEGCCNEQPPDVRPSSNWDAARLFIAAALILSLLPAFFGLPVPVEVIAGLAAVGWVMLLVEARPYDHMALPVIGLVTTSLAALVVLASGGSAWMTVPLMAASAWEVYDLWRERRLRAECAENGCPDCAPQPVESDRAQ